MKNRLIDAFFPVAMGFVFALLFVVLGATFLKTGGLFGACMCGLLALGTVATACAIAVDIVRN